MTFEQIGYVLEIVRTQSINKAANNLFISQPTLSQSIKNLEQELGNKLFIRSNKGVQLTMFGKTFLSYIETINLELQQINNIYLNKKQKMSLIIAHSGFSFVSELCSRLYQEHDSDYFSIEQYEVNLDEVIDMTSNGLADIGIIQFWDVNHSLYNKILRTKNLNFYPLLKNNVHVLLGNQHPCVTNCSSQLISAEVLRKFPVILNRYMDYGPNQDIVRRIIFPNTDYSRFVTDSRTVIIETLQQTDAFYICRDYSGFDSLSSWQLRNYILKDCPITSYTGYILPAHASPSTILNESITIMEKHIKNPSDLDPEFVARMVTGPLKNSNFHEKFSNIPPKLK